MAQKTLNAFVVISGRVDNSFGQIGTALVNMGQTVDQISQKLINFGKESIEVYRGYQDSMLDAQVALSTTYGRGSRELASVMKTLDAQATEWAASTIFHTDDVANAIAQAAHANWDLDMILAGIPNAMRLAQAGSMDLSEAVDFIIKSVNGAGLGFGELTEWIDEWTFAANSSAGDVAEFGEAMLKMGNTMQFAGSKEELLTMIAILHDSGTTGAAAGTLLRNSMLRLIAPTKKAKEAMAELGVTQEEMDEALSEVDGNTEAAVSRLEELGFSVYDDTGKLKDFVTIFHDLGKATEGMNDEEKYAIWSAIFPTRTITGGMALIEALTGDMNELYAALMGGEAEGYGEYAAETMMSGLTGSIETFSSKVERLKQITGEALSDDVTYWTDKLGQMVDSIAGMDEANFKGLVGGLEVIAGAGPGLLVAGSAFRFLGFALGTHAGRIAMAAIAIGALGKAINDYDEVKFEEKFGDMHLDMEPIKAHLKELTQPFNDARADLEGYVTAMNDAVQAYTDKSAELSSGIINGMLTKKDYTPEEIAAFTAMGDEIGGYIVDGIGSAYDAASESFTLVNGGIDQAATDPMWISFIGMMEVGYGQAIQKAQSLSQDLRNALTEGFADGHLTGEETEKIQNILNEMNQLLAMQTSAQNYAESERLMRRAQTLGLDGLEELTTEVNETRDAEIESLMYDRDFARGLAEAYLDAHVGEYWGDNYIDEEGVFKASYLADLTAPYDTAITERRGVYDDIIYAAYENAMHTSEFSDADQFANDLAQRVFSGEITEQEATAQYLSSDYNKLNLLTGHSTLADVNKYWDQEVEALGGAEAVRSLADYYRGQGNNTAANNYEALLWKSGMFESANESAAQSHVSQLTGGLYAPDYIKDLPTGTSEGAQEDQYTIPLTLDENGEVPTRQAQNTALSSPDELAQMYGFSNGGAAEASPYTIPLTIEGAEAAATVAYDEAQGALDSQGEVTIEATTQQEPGAGLPSPDELSQMYGFTIGGTVESTMTIEGAGEAASEAHNEAQNALDAQGDVTIEATTQQQPGVTLPSPEELMLVYGTSVTGAGEAASAARGEIESVVGPPVSTGVTFPGVVGTAAAAYSAIKGQFHDIVQHVRIVTSGGSLPGMATGGRATEPVVYGEAGPEWFIPERHDKNTASLIAMAAHASGFSLAELATMAGARMFAYGGSIGSSSAPMLETLVWADMDYSGADSSGSAESGNKYDVNYAPVIHAENAEGVDRVLNEDKKRLKKLLKELEEERELLGSVVSY